MISLKKHWRMGISISLRLPIIIIVQCNGLIGLHIAQSCLILFYIIIAPWFGQFIYGGHLRYLEVHIYAILRPTGLKFRIQAKYSQIYYWNLF